MGVLWFCFLAPAFGQFPDLLVFYLLVRLVKLLGLFSLSNLLVLFMFLNCLNCWESDSIPSGLFSYWGFCDAWFVAESV